MNTTLTSDIFLKRLRCFVVLIIIFSFFWFGDSIWIVLVSYESVIRYFLFFIVLVSLAYFIFFRKESDVIFFLDALSFFQKLMSSSLKPQDLNDSNLAMSKSKREEMDLYDVSMTSNTSSSKKPKPSTTQKRAVNGYTKRIVASKQEWKCLHCKQMLQASFEVDHILALSNGGSNEEENLVALCRNCHGEKTFLERTKS